MRICVVLSALLVTASLASAADLEVRTRTLPNGCRLAVVENHRWTHRVYAPNSRETGLHHRPDF